MTRVPVVRVKLVRDGSIPAPSRHVTRPAEAAALFVRMLADSDREQVVALYVDTRGRAIAVHTISLGSLNRCVVHPRELFKAAILANAHHVILAHVHPSGDPTPSQDDRFLTARVGRAGRLLGIPLVDHLIIAGDAYLSLREQGQYSPLDDLPDDLTSGDAR